jgi:phenylpropionate dioxygenase-like ring-hydroxylating dioxygenase large terminal subunit
MADVMQATLLPEFWYFALPGRKLRRGRMLARTLLGTKLVIGRRRDGSVFALRDLCPHRAMPLSFGHFDGAEIACCYHGWRFGGDGVCTAIPSLVDGQKFNLERVRVRAFPAREVQGNVWVFMGEGSGDAADIARVEGLDARAPGLVASTPLACDVDNAIVGLMDPAHGPFVHGVWWWRSKRDLREKSKAFAPSPLGFTMVRHQPSRNSLVFRLFGASMETEIDFRLPGVRIERIFAGERLIYAGLTAITPETAERSIINHAIWWTPRWISAMKPALAYFMHAFIGQDRRAMTLQRHGLAQNPPLMLINDADTQAKWYFALKKEYLAARDERRPFRHPVEPTTLRWRS